MIVNIVRFARQTGCDIMSLIDFASLYAVKCCINWTALTDGETCEEGSTLNLKSMGVCDAIRSSCSQQHV